MKASPLSDTAAQQQLDAVLTQLAEQVRRRVPGVQCRIQHGANDHFPWWVVARFSNPADDGKIVDISLECRSAGPTLAIQADLAREDGTVLQEFPEHDTSPLPVNGATSPSPAETLRGLESFLLQQVDCLSAELAC
jgi:hypothetical protein